MTNRVWFDARSLSRGYTSGWERYVRELAKHLPNLIDLTLWSPDTTNHLKLLISDFQTRKSQKGHKLVHFPTYPPLNVDKHIKQVTTVHDLTWWKFPETSSFLGKNYYKKNMEKAIISSDLIICPSHAIKKEVNEKFLVPNEDIDVIPHGNSLPQGSTKTINKPYFLSIGTVEPRKNLNFYSEAIKKSNLESDFDFLHAGRVGWAKLPENLKLSKIKDDQGLADLITNARAVVIPSLYEGFGLPVLEAHTQGVPVIMSNVESLQELSNKQDKIFELNDIDSFVDSLFYFSKNDQKLENNLIEKAKNYTWEKSAQLHVDSYLKVLNEQN